MRLIRSVDRALRQFVLGELREQPRLEIEERLITDPAAFEALRMAEQELAEEYVDGTLSPADRGRFERQYLTDREHRRHLSFVRQLKAYAAAAPRPSAAPAGGWRRIGDVVRFNPGWSAAAAAILVLLVGGNFWFVRWNYRLQGQFDLVRAQQLREAEVRQQLQGQVAALTSQADTLQARIESQRGAATEPPTFGLVPGRLRGGAFSAFNSVAVPAGAPFVRLQLQLADAADRASYRAVLADDAGEEIWSQARLTAEVIGGRAMVVVWLSAPLLSQGDYQLTLTRPSAAATPEIAGTYVFRVSR